MAVAGAPAAAGSGAAVTGAGHAPNAGTALDDWPADCEERYVIRARGAARADDTSKFHVAANSEYAVAFISKAPWGNKSVQLLHARSLIDNPRIVHHWTLFAVDSSELGDGEIQGGPGQSTPAKLPGEAYVVGGTIGSQVSIAMPDGVGLRVPSGPNVMLRLEVHYSNLGGEQAFDDATGAEVCVTTHKREHEAAAHWLGTYLIDVPAHSRADAVSECKPTQQTEPVHLVAIAPHMHKTGVNSRVVIHRKAGGTQPLLDVPYAFTEQRGYYLKENTALPPQVIQPGDTLTSTCSYQNDTDRQLGFGETSNDEMCFVVVWGWPAGQLSNGSLLGSLVGATPDLSCLVP
jgi:hypothetical protein